jgi:hypothetical protein
MRDRAVAQTVSRWLPTAAARVHTRVWSCGICGGQSGTGAGFLRVLRFPLPIFIPPISPQSRSPIIRGWYNRPVVAAVSKVPPHKLKKKPVHTPVTVTQWSKSWTVLARLDAGIVGSNPTRGMHVYMYVYVYSVFVLSCVGTGLAMSWSLVQGVPLTLLD